MGKNQSANEFDFNQIKEFDINDRLITIRVPDEYKTKYDIIQAMSRKRFADHLRQLIVAAIDRVDLESTKAC